MAKTYRLTSGSTIVRQSDGAVIPADHRNRDYRDYLEWAAAGNTADPAPIPPKPTTLSAGDFLARFTTAEQQAVQQACLANPQLMLGLTTGLAIGSIDLTGIHLATWMQGLVTAGALTQARATAIITP